MAKEMKIMYQFSAEKVELVDEKREEKAENGSTRTIIEKVEKKNPKKYAIRRPNRILYENYDMFYGPYLAKLIKGGHLTTQMLIKRFDDDDGILSKSERATYKSLKEDFIQNETKLAKLETMQESEKTEEDKAEISERFSIREGLHERIIGIEMSQNHLFEQTAESKARIKGLFWWLMYLSYIEKDGEFKPLFLKDSIAENSEEDTFENRLSVYDEIEETQNQHLMAVVRRIIYLLSVWSSSSLEMKEQKDFEKFDKELAKKIEEDKKNQAEKSEEAFEAVELGDKKVTKAKIKKT